MRLPFTRLVVATASFLAFSGSSQAQTGADTLRPPRPAAISQLAFEKAGGSCAHPMGMRAGQNLEYQLLNNKGKATGTWRYRVIELSTDSMRRKNKKPVAITKVLVKSGLYDLANRVLAQQDLTHFCRNDTAFTDGLAHINYEALKSFRKRRLAFQGTPLAWPNHPTVGSSLSDGGVVIQVSSPAVDIAKIRTQQRQRKVLAGPGFITVPAGTFQCYTIESQREASTTARPDLVFKNSGREVNYYAPGVGIIKTELFDNNGRLVQTRVLTIH